MLKPALILFLIQVCIIRRLGINTVDGVLCNSTGSFPDQNDCRKFYSCYRIGTDAIDYTCPSDRPFYHAKKKACRSISKDQAASLCPILLSPTPTASSSGSLIMSHSEISPSSPVSMVYSQYTTLLTQGVIIPSSSGKTVFL